MWLLIRFFNPDSFELRYRRGEATIWNVVNSYREALGVFNYLSVPRVHRALIDNFNHLRDEFGRWQNQWNSDHPNDQVRFTAYWDEWIREFLQQVRLNAITTAENGITALNGMTRRDDDNGDFDDGLAEIEDLKDKIRNSAISDTGLT
jgi:hypothetical protein